MTTTSIDPVRLQQGQLDDAGAVLGRAFHTNPGFVWMFSGEASRPKKLSWFMRAGTKVGHKDGEVYTTAGKVEGAAVWLPPGKTTLTFGQMIGAGMLAAPVRWGVGPFMKFMRMMNRFEHEHKQAMPHRASERPVAVAHPSSDPSSAERARPVAARTLSRTMGKSRSTRAPDF